MIGNCGVTFAPCKPSDRDYLARMMESVEDIPRDSINAGLPWDWETYGEYLASIDRMDKGINVGGMVGHCAVRVHVMGERSLSEDPAEATDDDIARMWRPCGRSHRRRRPRLLHLPHLPAQGAGWPPRARHLRRPERTPSPWARVLGRHGKGIFEGALRIGERDREEGLAQDPRRNRLGGRTLAPETTSAAPSA